MIIKKSAFPVESRIDLNTFGTFAFPIGHVPRRKPDFCNEAKTDCSLKGVISEQEAMQKNNISTSAMSNFTFNQGLAKNSVIENQKECQ